MAYAALVSLKKTLHRLLHSPHIFANASPTRKILQSAYDQTTSLQQVLKRLNGCSTEKLNAVDEQIRDEMHKLEDLLEFHESDNCRDSEEITEGIQSFCETVENINKDCVAEIGHTSPEDDNGDDDNQAIPSDVRVGTDSFEYSDVKKHLTERMRPNDFGFFQITGLPGSGATIAAAAILEDLKHCFDCRAWARVGPTYKRKDILLNLLTQIDENGINAEGGEEEEIGEALQACLKGRRYMIVLDDIRGAEIWNFLVRFFPAQDNGSAVLFTTRKEMIRIDDSFMLYDMASGHQDNWWYLFRGAVFDLEVCPPQLEEAGKKIVENCKSRAIVVLKVILHLLKAEETPDYWNHLAADEQNPIFMVDDELSEIQRVQEELFGADYSYMDDEERGLLLDLIDFSRDIENIKMEIFPKMFFPKMLTISFLGMAGIGKTSLARKIFQDPNIRRHFDHHLWVALGSEYKFEQILIDILAQIHPDGKNCIKGEEDLSNSLCAQLSDKKCLLVLDDVWSKKSLHYIRKLVPSIKGATLVTTRLSNVAQIGQRDIVFKMRLLNKEESWKLFCEHLFGEEKCPIQLERAGKKIVENCEGLPLMIVTVARLLHDTNRTPECWNDVAQRNSPIFMAAYAQISEILVPSYDHLPQYLKACFLYIGIFSQNKVIPASKLIIFWTAEGFLEPDGGETVEDYAAECLLQLESQSLVMVSQKGSSFKIKSCGLHSVFWHLSNSIAKENKFFQAFTTLADGSIEEGVKKQQRRLCIRSSTLLGIKEVHDSIASISTVRSLLCTAPSHPYPVPVYLGLRLLRLMDALSIRLYEFPIEVVKSYCLRYLALTYNESLPCSISKLRNLQFLIVSRYLSIKSSTDSSNLPMEIWDMEELKHLQIAGSNLPNPKYGVVRRNLLTLVGVSAHTCTKKVIKGVPNLKRLGIQIELDPDERGNPFRCLNRVARLHRLESLKCVVVNPDFMSEIVSPPAPRSMFPLGLKKLSLSGFGYPWDYMKIISKLYHLRVLKLRCYAFQGPEWEMDDDDLIALEFLLIEDTDLIRWKFLTACFTQLKCLCIRHCYQLEELPRDLPASLETLEVVDCNPFVENWAKEFEEHVFNFQSISSWNAKSIKT